MTKDQKRMFIFYLLPVLVYAVLILYLSVLPVGNAPPGPEPLPEPGEPGAEPADSPAYSQPAKSILWMKYNIPFFDIIANLGLYFIFGLLLYRMLRTYIPVLTKKIDGFTDLDYGLEIKLILTVTVFGLIYSIFNELLQNSLVSRIPDKYDILYNTVGTGLGGFTMLLLYLKRKR